MTMGMVIAAARSLAEATSSARISAGALYPPVTELRVVARMVALAVAREAVTAGVAGIGAAADLEAEIDGTMWWPAYAPYRPASGIAREQLTD